MYAIRSYYGLHEMREPDGFAETPYGLRDHDDIGKRRLLRVEIQHTPVGTLESIGTARPQVEGDRPEIDQVQERFFIVADEIVDLPLCLLAPHALGPDPLRDEFRVITSYSIHYTKLYDITIGI